MVGWIKRCLVRRVHTAAASSSKKVWLVCLAPAVQGDLEVVLEGFRCCTTAKEKKKEKKRLGVQNYALHIK